MIVARTAWVAIRELPHYRRDAFVAGLQRLGFRIQAGAPLAPIGNDVLVTWNRYGPSDKTARTFEARGLPVIVVENGYLGNEFAHHPGRRWYAMSLGQHNGAGVWPQGGRERWDALGIELKPWRTGGAELVALPQRGIGPPGVAMPPTWTRGAQKLARVRPHPGRHAAADLERDLAKARAVITWGSGAALKALAWGIPVFHSFKQWIGAPAARLLDLIDQGPVRDDEARLAMFARLAWAQAELREIESGDAIARLLECKAANL
jgi:hypothetical protein